MRKHAQSVRLSSTLAIGLLVFCFLSGCQSPPENPPAVAERVQLDKYSGLWYELARLPVPFQKDDERATAEYRLEANGVIELTNTAIAPDGSQRSVGGTAIPVEGANNTKLKVTIDNFFAKLFGSPPDYGNYWILKLAPDYSLALVGSPNRKTLWLLSRKSEISKAELQRYLEHAKAEGFATEKMIINNGNF